VPKQHAPEGVLALGGARRGDPHLPVMAREDLLAVAGRVHPAVDDLARLGRGMPCTPARRDDLANMVVSPRLGMDHGPRRCPLHAEHLVPADVARVDGPVDRVVAARAMLLERGGRSLEMLHLPAPGHPLGVGLGRLLECLVVGAGLEAVLFPLGVDPAEDISDEGGILGLGRHGENHRPS